ncbi:mCG148030 [Mus musculus]|nr:mCG148030 [Mus musculus]
MQTYFSATALRQQASKGIKTPRCPKVPFVES